MEKRTPHYALAQVKQLIEEGSYRVTETALNCAAHDFGLIDACQLATHVLKLERRNFYKSMTAYANSRLWHDVYHTTVREVSAYIKIQLIENRTLIISFKQRERD